LVHACLTVPPARESIGVNDRQEFHACPASPAGQIEFIFPSGRPDGAQDGNYHEIKMII